MDENLFVACLSLAAFIGFAIGFACGSADKKRLEEETATAEPQTIETVSRRFQ